MRQWPPLAVLQWTLCSVVACVGTVAAASCLSEGNPQDPLDIEWFAYCRATTVIVGTVREVVPGSRDNAAKVVGEGDGPFHLVLDVDHVYKGEAPATLRVLIESGDLGGFQIGSAHLFNLGAHMNTNHCTINPTPTPALLGLVDALSKHPPDATCRKPITRPARAPTRAWRHWPWEWEIAGGLATSAVLLVLLFKRRLRSKSTRR